MLTLSEERKFHLIFARGSESSRERKFLGTRVPGNESTRERKFHVWNFRSWERKYVGTKVPVTINSHEIFTRCSRKNTNSNYFNKMWQL